MANTTTLSSSMLYQKEVTTGIWQKSSKLFVPNFQMKVFHVPLVSFTLQLLPFSFQTYSEEMISFKLNLVFPLTYFYIKLLKSRF